MRSTNKLFALVGAVMLVMLTFAPAAAGAVSVANGNEEGNAPDDAGNAPADNFGLQVSEFVHNLMEEDIPDNETFGTLVAEFVLANNPAADKIPDHAGPPDHAGNASDDAGPPGNAGPPDDAGPPGNAGTQGNDNGGNGGNGPPDDAGNDGADGRDKGKN